MASAGMSSRRSRSAGSRSSMVLMRNSRSWRKRPAATSAWRSALVAEIRRTLARRVRDEPSRSKSPVSSTRSSLFCWLSGTLAISSRNSVPPSAISKRPTRSALASVKAPRTWPNSSLSKTPSETPPALTVTSGRAARGRDRVQRLRDQALAGAVLAGDQDVGVGGADARDHLQHRLHRRGVRDQVRLAVAAQHQVLGFEPLAAAQRARQLDLRPHDGQQPRVVPRLLDEVAGAAAHRLDGDVDAAPGGHHHRRQRRVHGPHGVQEVEAFLARGRVAGVVQVHQEDVELLVLERGDDAGRRGGGVDQVALGLEQQPQRLEHVGLVVGDEQPARRRRGAGALAIFGQVETRRKGVGRMHAWCRQRECYSLRRACAGSTARARRTGSHIASEAPRAPSSSAAPRERRRVERADAGQEGRRAAAPPAAATPSPATSPIGGQPPALAEHEPHDRSGRGAERQADADFARPLRDGPRRARRRARAATGAARRRRTCRSAPPAICCGSSERWCVRRACSSARIGSAGSTARIASRTAGASAAGSPVVRTCSLACAA